MNCGGFVAQAGRRARGNVDRPDVARIFSTILASASSNCCCGFGAGVPVCGCACSARTVASNATSKILQRIM